MKRYENGTEMFDMCWNWRVCINSCDISWLMWGRRGARGPKLSSTCRFHWQWLYPINICFLFPTKRMLRVLGRCKRLSQLQLLHLRSRQRLNISSYASPSATSLRHRYVSSKVAVLNFSCRSWTEPRQQLIHKGRACVKALRVYSHSLDLLVQR